MSDVRVIDAIIPPLLQERLEKLVLDNDGVAWTFVQSANFGTGKDVGEAKSKQQDTGRFLGMPNVVDTPQFVHNMYRHQELLPSFGDLFLALRIQKLLRAKINITLPDPRHAGDSHGYPHSDLADLGFRDYTTAIYYLNDSEGDTFIFNERVGESFNAFTVHSRVTPKRGRAVVFDGNRYHAGNNPRTHRPRALINLNYIPVG